MRAQLTQQVKQYQAKGTQWWQKREPRERQLLSVMAVLLLVAIFWYGIWQPLNDATARAETQLAAQQETLRFVIENTRQIEQLRTNRPQQAQAQAVSSEQLSSFVSRTSGQFNLEVTRLQPQNDALQVVYNEADFDALLSFLALLNERQIQIEAIDIAEAGEPGVVRVRRLQLRAGGA